MKKQKVEPLNLPYASTVASFFGDQQGAQGNSFLGRFFSGGQRRTNTNTFSSPVSPVSPGPSVGGGGRDRVGDRPSPSLTVSPRPRPNPRLN